jgi:hypothetical protein
LDFQLVQKPGPNVHYKGPLPLFRESQRGLFAPTHCGAGGCGDVILKKKYMPRCPALLYNNTPCGLY